MVKISFIKTLWGVTEPMGNSPSGYDALFARIKAEGFDGIETPVSLIDDAPAFVEALKKHGMSYVAMINTCTFAPDAPSSGLEDHLKSFERLLEQAKPLHPIFINSHSGRDCWSFDTSCAFFERALQLQQKHGAVVYHETHRGRILYSPWATRDLCKKFPNLLLTADLSHWCVVAERIFSASSGFDDDWPEILDIVADRTRHIHARVGYAQGPQVPDPAAPEYKSALESHESWWDAILTRRHEAGAEMMTVEPEHGTHGYQQCLPYTQVETADIWKVNKWMRDRQAARMSSQAYYTC